MILNDLSVFLRTLEQVQGELKTLVKATMLLKTNEVRSTILIKATMCMKTKQLTQSKATMSMKGNGVSAIWNQKTVIEGRSQNGPAWHANTLM
jgi:hypothetical protein